MRTKPMKLIDTHCQYRSPVLSLYQLLYLLPSGQKLSYEIVSRLKTLDHITDPEHHDTPANGVSIIITDPQKDKILLLEEFRPSINRFLWRVPTGLIDRGEMPADAAIRETHEETGLTIHSVRLLPNAAYNSDGISDSRTFTVFATADSNLPLHPVKNEKEPITPVWFTREEAKHLIYGPANGLMNERTQNILLWFIASQKGANRETN